VQHHAVGRLGTTRHEIRAGRERQRVYRSRHVVELRRRLARACRGVAADRRSSSERARVSLGSEKRTRRSEDVKDKVPTDAFVD
jgi:hypothetical protein